jgi:hypothetical protein
MVENEGVVLDEQAGGIPTGAIVAGAIAAGVIAFMIRRAKREPRIETPADVAAAAWERVQDPDFRARTAGATRDFLMDRVGHELKPVLLELLHDVKEYVDQGFKRAEKAVRDL